MAGASSREVARHLNTLFRCGAAGQISDQELLERFVTGREEVAEAAFAALVERHGVMVLGVCRRVLGNRDAAEDAFQAAFLVLARKAAVIARREQLASWLHGVARHVALDARAREARQKAREKRLGAMRPVEPTDLAEASELRSVLDEELGRLPERHRAAIVLCELEGLSRRDAAARLGIPEGTLSSRLARGRSQLKDRLTRRGFALTAAALSSVLAHDAHAVLLPPLLVDSTTHVATLVAAGSSLAGVASTSVLALSEGVLKAMLLSKLKFAFLGLVALTVVSTSVGVVAQGVGDRPSDNDRLKAVERKLDRLLEVLGGPADKAPAVPPRRIASSPTQAPVPHAVSAVPPVATSPDLAPPIPPVPVTAQAPVPHPVPPMPPAPGSPHPGPAHGSDSVSIDPTNPHLFGVQGRNTVDSRIHALEQRLVELERRFGELERRVNQSGPLTAPRADIAEPPLTSDAPSPFVGTTAPDGPPSPTSPDGPPNAPGDDAPFE